MELGEKSPDAKTIWLFKEKLGEDGMRELFDLFNTKLHDMGVVKWEGSIVDAIDKEAWLDSAYASTKHIARVKEMYPDIILHINEKVKINHPLTDEQTFSLILN